MQKIDPFIGSRPVNQASAEHGTDCPTFEQLLSIGQELASLV